jgi:hypothetical protein
MKSLIRIALAALLLMAGFHVRADEAMLSSSGEVGGYVVGDAGWTFQPVTNILVTSLGCFDYLFSEQQGPIEVGLWASDGTLLASNVISNSSPLVDQSRYEPITPVTLRTTLTYYVAAYSTNGELLLDAEAPGFGFGGSATTSSGIELETAAFSTNGFNSGLVFPTDLLGGPGAAALTANFQYTVAPPVWFPLSISADGNELILTWTNAVFSLQSAPDLSSTFTNIPGATSPYTNIISSPQGYFRLNTN